MRKILVTILAIAGTLGLAHGQAGAGKKYGARDPFVCKSRKEPAKGAPSPSQISDYLRCTMETDHPQAGVYFENVRAEVGTSRPYAAFTDSGAGDIDNYQPVYPIRGKLDQYYCLTPYAYSTGKGVGEVRNPPGHNCTLYQAAAFRGICYKTTFGDWSCTGKLNDWNAGAQKEMPPPK